jgi:hypothetical protein
MVTPITPQEAYNLFRKNQEKDARGALISTNFTWGDVFIGTLIYEIKDCALYIFDNALKQSMTMEKVREHFGNKRVYVHSWYRSIRQNNEVHGATHSEHLVGLATDFHIEGMETLSGNRIVQMELDKAPFMQNCGLEFTGGNWTHVDSRGTKARFTR